MNQEILFQHFATFLQILTKYDVKNPNILGLQIIHQELGRKKPLVDRNWLTADKIKEFHDKKYAWIKESIEEIDNPYVQLGLGEFGIDGETPYRWTKNEVTRIRSFCVDIDFYLSDKVIDNLIAILEPTCVVGSSSKGEGTKTHFYFVLAYDEPKLLEPGVFRNYQYSLAKYVDRLIEKEGVVSEEAFCDDQRVSVSSLMRVPGFWHLKDKENPSPSYLNYSDTDAYIEDLDTFTEELGLQIDSPEVKSVDIPKDGSVYKGVSEGGRNAKLFNFVKGYCFQGKDLDLESATGVALMHNIKNDPPLEHEEVVAIVESAHSHYIEYKNTTEKKRKKQEKKLAEQTKKITAELEEDEDGIPLVQDITSESYFIATFCELFGDELKSFGGQHLIEYNNESNLWEKVDRGLRKELDYTTQILRTREDVLYQFDGKTRAEIEKACKEYYRKMITCNKIAAFETRLQSGKDGINLSPNLFDKHPNCINTPDGLINLQTGENLGKDKDHLLTQTTLCSLSTKNSVEDYMNINDWNLDPFTKNIYEVCSGDTNLAEYLQVLLGIQLLRGNPSQSFCFFYGDGANGKSTLLDAYRRILNTYVGTVNPQLFLTSNYGTNTNSSQLFSLVNKRVAITSEVPHDTSFNESLIKEISGQEEIQVRQLRCNAITVDATFSIIMQGNALPEIKGQDSGIWRRLHLVPFERNFKKEGVAIDPYDHINNLVAAGPEALSFLVAGARKYLEAGDLKPFKPNVAKEVEGRFYLENNPIGAFAEEFLDIFSLADLAQKSYPGMTFEDIEALYIIAKDILFLPEKASLGSFSRKLSKAGIKNKVFKEDGKTVRRYSCMPKREYIEKLRATGSKFNPYDVLKGRA